MTAITSGVPAGASSLTPVKGYKWIAKEIERLDPKIDYARIWALSSLYYTNDFVLNLSYSTGLPGLIQNPDGAEILKRTAKISKLKQQRSDDTISHFWHWWENGPNHIDTIRAIEEVNRIHHALYMKVMPEAFALRDYVYAPCSLGTGPHRFAKMVGLPGFSEKQKIASHLFWKNIMAKMRSEEGYIVDFPESFDAMERFVEDFNNEKWPKSEVARTIIPYVISQFNERNLPKPFWGLGRQMILTFTDKRARDLHEMGDPNPIIGWLIKRFVKINMWLSINVLPDPKLSVPERARQKGDIKGQHKTPRMVAASACPYLQLHGNQEVGNETDVPTAKTG
ncbi:hypothetical protein [Sinorhizobium saheli]|uniref:ER-bound oxygenase mpaB/mpaB'/Rubber oxygenase catalytic domain-containing protein n=1 Tax=Sinorhizobium saheli TaxID=36856 RepID=A0A178YSP4_SINSA|nr:hypothetical protein [Sinorhizobium saheli]MQW87698.1 DUF2236 domain-containing protein [Sinorhizobium saheli]OAP49893.1 hypothetical protein ATB98_03265 [Sinorhizobium saheli]